MEAEDYDKVIANGVEVKDKIVLVKYGGKTPEPNKVYIAAAQGQGSGVYHQEV